MVVFEYDSKNILKQKHFVEYKSDDDEGPKPERILQDFIFKNPQLFPVVECSGESASRWIPLAMEITLEGGAGRLDIFATDDDGNVYIIECKLENNKDGKTIRSQINNYAAGFWYQKELCKEDPEKFWRWLCDRIEKQSLEKIPLEKILEKESENNIKKIIENMKENISNDNIILIFAVDEITPTLSRDIDWWNAAVNQDNNYPSFAYEVRRYSDVEHEEEITSVVTQTYPFDLEGLIRKRQSINRKIRDNNLDLWKEKMQQSNLNPKQIELMNDFKNDLYDLLEKDGESAYMDFGGGVTPLLMPKFDKFNLRSPISLEPTGILGIKFGLISLYKETKEKFEKKLLGIDEIKDQIKNRNVKSPNLQFEDWFPVKDEILDILEELFMKNK